MNKNSIINNINYNKYNQEQLKELLLGAIDYLDLTRFSSTELTASEMKQIRERLLLEKDYSTYYPNSIETLQELSPSRLEKVTSNIKRISELKESGMEINAAINIYNNEKQIAALYEAALYDVNINDLNDPLIPSNEISNYIIEDDYEIDYSNIDYNQLNNLLDDLNEDIDVNQIKLNINNIFNDIKITIGDNLFNQIKSQPSKIILLELLKNSINIDSKELQNLASANVNISIIINVFNNYDTLNIEKVCKLLPKTKDVKEQKILLELGDIIENKHTLDIIKKNETALNHFKKLTDEHKKIYLNWIESIGIDKANLLINLIGNLKFINNNPTIHMFKYDRDIDRKTEDLNLIQKIYNLSSNELNKMFNELNKEIDFMLKVNAKNNKLQYNNILSVAYNNILFFLEYKNKVVQEFSPEKNYENGFAVEVLRYYSYKGLNINQVWDSKYILVYYDEGVFRELSEDIGYYKVNLLPYMPFEIDLSEPERVCAIMEYLVYKGIDVHKMINAKLDYFQYEILEENYEIGLNNNKINNDLLDFYVNLKSFKKLDYSIVQDIFFKVNNSAFQIKNYEILMSKIINTLQDLNKLETAYSNNNYYLDNITNKLSSNMTLNQKYEEYIKLIFNKEKQNNNQLKDELLNSIIDEIIGLEFKDQIMNDYKEIYSNNLNTIIKPILHNTQFCNSLIKKFKKDLIDTSFLSYKDFKDLEVVKKMEVIANIFKYPQNGTRNFMASENITAFDEFLNCNYSLKQLKLIEENIDEYNTYAIDCNDECLWKRHINEKYKNVTYDQLKRLLVGSKERER